MTYLDLNINQYYKSIIPVSEAIWKPGNICKLLKCNKSLATPGNLARIPVYEIAVSELVSTCKAPKSDKALAYPGHLVGSQVFKIIWKLGSIWKLLKCKSEIALKCLATSVSYKTLERKSTSEISALQMICGLEEGVEAVIESGKFAIFPDRKLICSQIQVCTFKKTVKSVARARVSSRNFLSFFAYTLSSRVYISPP